MRRSSGFIFCMTILMLFAASVRAASSEATDKVIAKISDVLLSTALEEFVSRTAEIRNIDGREDNITLGWCSNLEWTEWAETFGVPLREDWCFNFAHTTNYKPQDASEYDTEIWDCWLDGGDCGYFFRVTAGHWDFEFPDPEFRIENISPQIEIDVYKKTIDIDYKVEKIEFEIPESQWRWRVWYYNDAPTEERYVDCTNGDDDDWACEWDCCEAIIWFLDEQGSVTDSCHECKGVCYCDETAGQPSDCHYHCPQDPSQGAQWLPFWQMLAINNISAHLQLSYEINWQTGELTIYLNDLELNSTGQAQASYDYDFWDRWLDLVQEAVEDPIREMFEEFFQSQIDQIVEHVNRHYSNLSQPIELIRIGDSSYGLEIGENNFMDADLGPYLQKFGQLLSTSNLAKDLVSITPVECTQGECFVPLCQSQEISPFGAIPLIDGKFLTIEDLMLRLGISNKLRRK